MALFLSHNGVQTDGGAIANLLFNLMDRRDEEEFTLFGCSTIVVRERVRGFDNGRWKLTRHPGPNEFLELEAV